ncbi:MAG: ABC transporter ATP-binding protein/permease [Burkholderiales bacterium]|nr:ABC transporter ATP-binding protein/permease [Burkholderiales bacterium]
MSAPPLSTASGTRPRALGLLGVPRALLYFLGEDRKRYLWFSAVLLAVQFYTLLPPYLIGRVADFLLQHKPGESLTPMYWTVATLGVAHAVVAMIRLSTKRVIGRMSTDARYRAKVWGFERLLDFSLAWHQQESTGNKAQRVITGAEAVREWSADLMNNLFVAIAAFFGSLVACMWLWPASGLFFVYFVGVLIWLEWFFYRRIARLSDAINASQENASGSFVESAANILSVKAMGAAGSLTGKVAERESLARDFAYQRLRLTNSKWMAFQMHSALAWALYILGVAIAVLDQRLSVGMVLTYAAYFNTLREASMDMTDKVQTMIERTSNLGRMMPVFETRAPTGGSAPFPADWDAIRWQGVRFAYPGGRELGPVELSLRRGESLGVAGPSGSGKSTLVKLLLGLYPVEQGRLTIGDTDLADIRHEALTSQIAVVLQETELFNLSLRENITLSRKVGEADFRRACRIACLDELIARLPDGVETLVGEKGHVLSGGERQRVGIARAVLRDAPILLLDEATSALDSATESRVLAGLMTEHAGGRTVLVVAHRPSAFEHVDRRVEVAAGCVIGEPAAA